MSGTSCDGVDVAALETDGYGYVKPLGFLTVPYDEGSRKIIRSCFGRQDTDAEDIKAAAHLLTLKHAEAVHALLDDMGESADTYDLCGFHGQTIYHAPKPGSNDGVTIQIGDGDLLSSEIGIDVVYDFRSADVRAGGQGAPLAPLYHRARILSAGLDLPVVILNIGGVANVTYIQNDDILAFDCGPGNALMDDYTNKRTGGRYDENGNLAKNGQVIDIMLNKWLKNPYFSELPPKSLDRDEWDIADLGQNVVALDGVSVEDGLATLSAFTRTGIMSSLTFFPDLPKAWYVCGGGRHNAFLMDELAKALQSKSAGTLRDVSALGWNGDATEAECFGYLAVRSLLGEYLSVPGTTGVSAPQKGGILAKHNCDEAA